MKEREKANGAQKEINNARNGGEGGWEIGHKFV